MGITDLFNRLTREPRAPNEKRLPYKPTTQAGIVVTPDRALTIPALFCGIRFISETIGALPWHVMRQTAQGGDPAFTHPVDWLLHKRPSPEYSSFAFRELMVRWAILWGDAYAEIERDTIGRPFALHPLHPERVEPRRDEVTQRLYFRVNNGVGGSTDMDAADIFHLKGFGGDSQFGMDIVTYASETLGLARAQQLFAASFFGGGANPSGVVTMKKPMSAEALAELEKRFSQLYRGPRNANKTMFLDAEMDFKSISTDPEKAQLVLSQQHAIEDIARLLRVPPSKLMHLVRASYSSQEQLAIEAVQDSLVPWGVKLEDEADYKLFGQNRQGFYTKIDFTGLLRGDSAARATYYGKLREMGVASINEIRAWENLPSIGQEGDVRVVNSTYQTLETLMNPPKPVAPKAPATDDAPEDENEEGGL